MEGEDPIDGGVAAASTGPSVGKNEGVVSNRDNKPILPGSLASRRQRGSDMFTGIAGVPPGLLGSLASRRHFHSAYKLKLLNIHSPGESTKPAFTGLL